MEGLPRLGTGTAASREVELVALKRTRTIGSPLTQAGFRLAGTTKTGTFSVSAYVAVRTSTVSVDSLRRMSGEPKAEVILQHR